jgi:tRNA-2-methylthio-N6-dimethylallyladenosine synthase
LQALIAAQQNAFNASAVGRTLAVLLEKPGRDPGQLVGRSPYLQAVHLDADPSLIGMIVDTHITGVGSNSLSGHYGQRVP